MYQFDDKLEFTFHFGRYATLYFSNGGNNRVIAEGTLEIEDMSEENFNLIVDGRFIELFRTTLNARMFIRQVPSAFVMLVPDHGWRYFQKL
jgi:hypothetical protein